MFRMDISTCGGMDRRTYLNYRKAKNINSIVCFLITLFDGNKCFTGFEMKSIGQNNDKS